MSDWYSRAREADGRTDDEVMSEVKLREDAADFWAGKCRDCGHPEHEMTCHEPVSNGDPSNGPAYCPCAVQIENMEMEIVRLRRESDRRRTTIEGLRQIDSVRLDSVELRHTVEPSTLLVRDEVLTALADHE